MKVLLDDGRQMKVGTGIGKYSKYLYESLSKDKDLSIDLESYDWGGKKSFSRIKYLGYLNSKKYRLKSTQYDIIHYSNYAMPILKNEHSKYIVTIHDLVSFDQPGTLPMLYVAYSKWTICNAMKRADAIVTVSDYMKGKICDLFPRYKDKVFRIYPGYYSEIYLEKYNDDIYESRLLSNIIHKKKFFLFVGTIEERKNISFLIKAFAVFKKTVKDVQEYKLVLAGRPGKGYKEIVGSIKHNRVESDVILTGYISSADSNKLYNCAQAYIFPSIYEGFGSTQLECMACHTPLIASDIPTNHEVSGSYAFYFDLNAVDSLADKMRYVIETYPSEDRSVIADARLKEFHWENIEKQYKSLYTMLTKR